MNLTLANKAGFASLYGDYSLDYPTINSYGDIESKYSYFKYFGLALAIIGVIGLLAYQIKQKENKKNKKSKSKKSSFSPLLILGSAGLFFGGGLFIYYIYVYFYLYLPEYRNFYSDLPVEATDMLKNF